MTLTQAVSSVLSQYAGFRGRARRSEFWWWQVFTLLVGIVVATAEVLLGLGGESSGPVSTLLALALLLPNLSVCVRRLHDVSRSGWWLLIALLPFAGLVVLLVFFVAPSSTGWNAHGPDPRLPADRPEPAPDDLATQEPADPRRADAAPDVPTAGWTPPGWDLPSAAEPGAGRPKQSRAATEDDPGRERPQG